MSELTGIDPTDLARVPDEFWDRLSRIHCAAFSAIGEKGWSAESLRNTATSNGARVILMEPLRLNSSDEIKAFAVIRIIADEAELITLAVCPTHSGRGVGTSLLQNCLQAAKSSGAESMYLEVRANNRGAVHLYERAGFQPSSLRPLYYQLQDGSRHDAVLMSCRF